MSTAPLDMRALDREMERIKTRTFLGKNAAFYGPLMCNLNFVWNSEIGTACCDGVDLEWNPHFFTALEPATRETILRHELEHVARMHGLRADNRDPKIWNQACDHRINLDMQYEKDKHGQPVYSFKGIEWGCMDPKYGTKSEEEIYAELIKHYKKNPMPQEINDFGNDIKKPKDVKKAQAVSNVVRAIQQAKAAGKAGDIPGDIALTIEKFLNPVLDYRILLQRFFTDLSSLYSTWTKRNRRFRDMYMPALVEDEDRLEHLAYFLDVSFSVTDEQVRRFNSEVKYIKDTFNPKKLTLITFDTRIHDVYEFDENTPFNRIVVHGRGGTSLQCVRQWIIDKKPTAALIFTDLECKPMGRLPVDVPIIWAVLNNPGATVKYGTVVHIPPEQL